MRLSVLVAALISKCYFKFMSVRTISRKDWERELHPLGYQPQVRAPGRTADFATEDRSFVIEVLERPKTAVRDLRAKLLPLAAFVADDPGVDRACLLLVVDRLTRRRLSDEWSRLMSVLRPDVARRLALVAVGEGLQLCLPEESPALVELARVGRTLLESSAAPSLPHMSKSLEVLKVLLVRWLLGEGPIARGELGERAGCSYPTVAKAIERLAGVIREHTNRSVELKAFPHAAWHELLALSPTQRARLAYSDRTGRGDDPADLLRRLKKLKPAHVALGGVMAARHWDPHFDVRGIPRLDISVAAEEGARLDFLRRLDPGLGPVGGEGFPSVVVHPLQRPVPLFTACDDLPVADPVETLLDLNELRLVDQASAFIERLERRARASR